MNLLINLLLMVFLLIWSALGIWILARYQLLFGPHQDDPSETEGARSFGFTQVLASWFGFFALAWYFLLR